MMNKAEFNSLEQQTALMKKIIYTLTSLACSFTIYAQALYTTTLHGGANGGGTICKLEQGKLSATFNFDRPDGSHPSGKLLQAADGKLYGLTSQGGKFNVGTLFSYYPATDTYTQIRDFDTATGASPSGNLIQAKDGKLYGTTRHGGNDDDGVIFSYDITTCVYTKLVDFDITNSYSPNGSLVQAANGKLYGTTSDIIFSFHPASHVFTKVIDFNDSIGGFANDGLLQAKDGKLYGMTRFGGSYDDGVIFSLDPVTGVFVKLKDFSDSTGKDPTGTLIQALDGKLYGFTRRGGTNKKGSIFSFDPSTATYATVKDFASLAGIHPHGSLLHASNGKLYGISIINDGNKSRGIIFSYNPATKKYLENLFKQSNIFLSYHHLMEASDGKVYGASYGGGSGHVGALYSLNITTLAYKKLKDFGINNMGYEPRGGMGTDSAGVLYGSTARGGRYGSGVVYSYNTATSVYKKLWDSDNPRGGYYVGGWVYAKNRNLYGVVSLGGSDNSGSLISLNPATGKCTTVWQFTDSATGTHPQKHLIQGSDGKLYGMTNSGSPYWAGVLFSFELSSATFTKLYDLVDSTGKNGCSAMGNLIQASDNKLYGLTEEGGKHKAGVLFSFDLNTKLYTALIDFDYDSGARPYHPSLIQALNGKLYGTTDDGGDYGNGVLFSYDIATQVYKKLKDFIYAETKDLSYKEKRVGGLAKGVDGKLYGIWEREPFDLNMGIFGEQFCSGGVYCFDPVTSTYTKIQEFDVTTGLHPKDTFLTEVLTEISTKNKVPTKKAKVH